MDKWWGSVLAPPEWRDTAENPWWLKALRRIADDCGCGMVFDGGKSWRESYYRKRRGNSQAMVFAGGAGAEKEVCTAVLHELAHHLLRLQHQEPGEPCQREKAAWTLAARLAAEHRLPFDTSVKKEGAHSYRQGRLLRETIGSKAKQRRRPQPKTWKLARSKRTAAAIREGYPWSYPLGKRGKRGAKKIIKRATARAERKQAPPVD